MRIGVTGHQRFADALERHWVEKQIDAVLSQLPPPLIGLTSLAIGTDQIFAKAILQYGGTFTAIIPFAGYEEKFLEGKEREEYKYLLRLASQAEFLKRSGSGREAYFQAGKQVVHRSEFLLAVWNGLPAAGLGGTADVVEYATSCNKPVIIISLSTRTIERHGELPR